jgi:hypothetical protein
MMGLAPTVPGARPAPSRSRSRRSECCNEASDLIRRVFVQEMTSLLYDYKSAVRHCLSQMLTGLERLKRVLGAPDNQRRRSAAMRSSCLGEQGVGAPGKLSLNRSRSHLARLNNACSRTRR